jgi:hypothetical protein
MGNRYHAVFAAVLFFILSFIDTTLAAQGSVNGENEENGAAVFIFPVHRLWFDAQSGAVRWQPDWSLAIPPDSFDPATDGGVRQITITVTTVDEEPPEMEDEGITVTSIKYTMRFDSDSRLAEFPALLNGIMHQAFVEYDSRGAIETIALAVSPDELIEIVFLQIEEYMDEYRPVTARIKAGDMYYFASFRWTANTCIELWTDETGVPLEIFQDERVLHYDSMRNMTFINDGTSAVSAFYNGSGVRYWSTAEKDFAFQRDETGQIIRLTSIQKNASEEAVQEPPVNYSYEYQFDQNGNWTERREIRWFELKGYLVPSLGTLVTRFIDYIPVSGRE